MRQSIKDAASKFLESIKNKSISIISHHDTDGITSAAIMSRSLIRLRKRFSLNIIKQLESSVLEDIDNDVIVFLDLGSSSLEKISKLGKTIFVIDHHEITSDVPDNITLINPRLFGSEEVSGAGLTYLFCRELGQNKDLASLAVIGMVGDMLDREVSKLNNEILNDAEVVVKRGLTLYPATRPLNKALEFGSGLYIPGVTGNSKEVFNLLNEAGIKKEGNAYKSLIELTNEEMSKLITAILLRKQDSKGMIGNLYLIKFFNKLEDARGLSAMINACSRLGNSEIALGFCMNNKTAKEITKNNLHK